MFKLLSSASSALSGGSSVSDNVTEVEQAVQDASTSAHQWLYGGGVITTLITAAVVSVITFIVLKLLKHFLKKWLEGNLRIFYRLIYVLVLVIAVMVVLMTIDPLRDIGYAILASSGIAAVIIGLAAQQTLGNLFSGISISIAKPFLVGEFIEITGFNPPIAGTVKEVSLRHTKIIDNTNKLLVIPNSVLDKEMIRTFHSLDRHDIINYLLVYVPYGTDIDLAMRLIREQADQINGAQDVRTDEEKAKGVPATTILVWDLNTANITLRVHVWTTDPNVGTRVLSDLRYGIQKAFEKNGIRPPYPYQNVTVENAEREKP